MCYFLGLLVLPSVCGNHSFFNICGYFNQLFSDKIICVESTKLLCFISIQYPHIYRIITNGLNEQTIINLSFVTYFYWNYGVSQFLGRLTAMTLGLGTNIIFKWITKFIQFSFFKNIQTGILTDWDLSLWFNPN